MFDRYGLEDELEEINPELYDFYIKFFQEFKKNRFDFCSRFDNTDENSFMHARRVLFNADRIIDHCLYDLNEDEIFCFLLACLSCGSGMDDDEDYYNMDLDKVLADDNLRDNPLEKIQQMMYKFHYEFSSAFVDRSQYLIDQMNPEHREVVKRLCRVAQKKELYDRELLPEEYVLKNGNVVHLAYLGPVIYLASVIDNATELCKYCHFSVLEYDKFTQQYIDSLKLIESIRIRNHSIDFLMYQIPEENLGFTFFLQEMKDVFVTTKELIESNYGFYMRQNKLNVVDLNTLDTKVF